MSNAHKGSRLILKDQVIAVDFNTAHFDYNVDATGIQYGNIVEPLNGSVYTMRPYEGRFGGGVAVEQGTTNLITSPNSNTYNYSSGNVTQEIMSNGEFEGWNKTTISVQNTTNSLLCYVPAITLPSGNSYSYSMDFYCPNDTIRPQLNGTSGYGLLTNTGGKRWEKTIPIQTVNKTVHFYMQRMVADVTGHHFYWKDNQAENKAFATSFVKGTRANGWMSYPKELVNTASFTINMWVNFSTFLTATYQPLLEVCSSSHQLNRILLMYRDDVLQTWVSNSSSEVTNVITSAKSLLGDINSWAMVTFSFDGYSYKLHINGVLHSTTSSTLISTPTGTLNIGGRYWGALNGKICDVSILRRSATQEEIWSWYVSNVGLHNPHDSRSYAF